MKMFMSAGGKWHDISATVKTSIDGQWKSISDLSAPEEKRLLLVWKKQDWQRRILSLAMAVIMALYAASIIAHLSISR